MAAAMVIMGNSETPTEYIDENGEYHFWDWNQILQYPYNNAYLDGMGDEHMATEEIPSLFYHLGRPKNLNISYTGYGFGIDVDSTYTNVPRTFKNFGYENPGHFIPFNRDTAINEIYEGHPLFIQCPGHCWVCSSVIIQHIPVTVTNRYGLILSKGHIDYYLFHMNWSWDGAYNGFFYDGLFGPELFYISEDTFDFINPEDQLVFEDPEHFALPNVEILVGVRLQK